MADVDWAEEIDGTLRSPTDVGREILDMAEKGLLSDVCVIYAIKPNADDHMASHTVVRFTTGEFYRKLGLLRVAQKIVEADIRAEDIVEDDE